MRAALSDMYNHSWRLFVLNLALSVVAVAPLVAALWAVPALVLLLAVGPFAAALMHCAVTVQQTDDLRLRDGVVGLRLHWRRGLVLAALIAGVVVLVVTAISFYAPRAWPVALVALYGALLFGVWQIHVWPLAVARRRERLGAVLREAGRALGRRPLASIGLAFALLLVNAFGMALGVLPALTLTLAYSALAAAHFALPPPTEEVAS
jgi:hypothetical protein